MTVIAGVAGKDYCAIAGDSYWGNDSWSVEFGSSKVWSSGEWLLGFAGAVRPSQLVRQYCPLPVARSKSVAKIQSQLVREWIPRIQDALEDNGLALNDEDNWFSACICRPGAVYMLDASMQIGRVRNGYLAVGAGGSYAMGVLADTARQQVDPRQRLIRAMAAADKHCPAVKGPYRVLVRASG